MKISSFEDLMKYIKKYRHLRNDFNIFTKCMKELE